MVIVKYLKGRQQLKSGKILWSCIQPFTICISRCTYNKYKDNCNMPRHNILQVFLQFIYIIDKPFTPYFTQIVHFVVPSSFQYINHLVLHMAFEKQLEDHPSFLVHEFSRYAVEDPITIFFCSR